MVSAEELAPIVLFVYNRPEHTRKTVEALARNPLASKSTLYIFSDAAKNSSSYEAVNAVRSYISTLAESGKFRNVVIEKASENRGLAASVIRGVTQVVERYEKVIVLEDDLITAPDFLDFLNQSLCYYKTYKQIGSVTGYSPLGMFLKDYEKDVWVAPRVSSHGWATWADRWREVDWEISDFKDFSMDRQAIREFNRCGSDLYDRLLRQIRGNANSWATVFAYWQFRHNRLTVFPTKNRVKNIGWDGSGVHSAVEGRYSNSISNKAIPFQLTLEMPNKKILAEMNRLYSGPLSSRIARFMRTNGLEDIEKILRKILGK